MLSGQPSQRSREIQQIYRVVILDHDNNQWNIIFDPVRLGDQVPVS